MDEAEVGEKYETMDDADIQTYVQMDRSRDDSGSKSDDER